MRKDKLGDRMKRYELEEGGRRMMPLLPIAVRLDGRKFSSFTKGLNRPYDERFSTCMINTAMFLLDRWDANLAYTQSDEITLYWENANPDAQMPFDGRYHKLVSLLAASSSVQFYKQIMQHIPEKANKDPEFDCRVWQLPNLDEVFGMFLWREGDASTNSLQMAAQSKYSHKELHKKGRAELNELLFQKGINWNDYPAFFKRGTYVARTLVERLLTTDELEKVPSKHRHLHEGPVMRSEVRALDVPPIHTLQGRSDGQQTIITIESYKRCTPRALLG